MSSVCWDPKVYTVNLTGQCGRRQITMSSWLYNFLERPRYVRLRLDTYTKSLFVAVNSASYLIGDDWTNLRTVVLYYGGRARVCIPRPWLPLIEDWEDLQILVFNPTSNNLVLRATERITHV